MEYGEALELAHAIFEPRTYVEIGCRKGHSLRLAKCPSVAIDPEFEITAELTAPTRIFRQTSDAFFARPDVQDVLGGHFDLAFIDGMHQVEFALRDFINLERHASPGSVILIDDVLPSDMTWTTREREGQYWTGDVYRLIPLLRRYRPDLRVDVFDIEIKGLAVISGLNPHDMVLTNAYPAIERELAEGTGRFDTVEALRAGLAPILPVEELADRLRETKAGGPARWFGSSIRAPFLRGYQEGVLRYAYRGIDCLKPPIDVAIYLRALWDLKPRTIIEIGSKAGGSALMWADIATMYGLGAHVYSIDLVPPADVADERVTFLQGDVNDLGPVFGAAGILNAPRPWLVTEDSAHTYAGCRAALKYLAGVMQPGDVLVMEDGNLAELNLEDRYDGGPSRALFEFLAAAPGCYEVMTELCDMFGPNATSNPNGYLRKL